MRKLIACVLMVATTAAMVDITTSPSVAQTEKKGKDKTTKKADGIIEIAEGKDGKFRFFVRDAEGKLLAMSSPGGFESDKDARKAIDDLKSVISTAKVAAKKVEKTDK